MLTVELDPAREKRLSELAKSRGQDAPAFVRTVLEDYLDLESLPADSEEAWAETSLALTPEILEEETWEGDANGSG